MFLDAKIQCCIFAWLLASTQRHDASVEHTKIILVSLSICFLAVILWLTSRRHRLIGLVAEQVARLSAKWEAPTIPTPTAPRITARRGSMVLEKHFHRTGHQHHLPPTGAYAGTGAGATLGRWHSFKLSFGTIFLIDLFENNNKSKKSKSK